MESILMFSSRNICYGSGGFFARQLGAAFGELGFSVEICEFTLEDDFSHILEPFLGKTYRAVVDFNSLLPKVVMEDGTPFLERIKSPFFDYVLDHPLFQYQALVQPVKNLYALVLDEGQCAYVRRYHPALSGVSMLPLAGTGAPDLCAKDGEYVLFLGTYDGPDAVHELVKAAPEPLRFWMDDVIAQRISDPCLPMEEALWRTLEKEGIAVDDARFALILNALYPADAFVRDYFRKAALDGLIKKKIPVRVAGSGWQNYCPPDEKYLTVEEPLPIDQSFERIARAPVLLNVSPMFNRGIHDRMLAGMANHTAVLTDENPYLREHFRDGKDLSLYSLTRPEDLGDRAGELLENHALREQIAESGYQTFREGHTWLHRTREIVRLC